MKKKITKIRVRVSFYKDILLITAFFLILISLAGLIASVSPKNQFPIGAKNKNTLGEAIASNSIFGFFPLSSSASGRPSTPTPVPPSPTPTPITHFRHSKWFFSFDLPRVKNFTIYETDPSVPKLVENSIGSVYFEIPNRLYTEIAVVQPLGQNLEQYYYNRMAMIFNETILDQKTASISAQLAGFEADLEDSTTGERKILLFLPFRGSQFFEIEAVFPKKKHDKEKKMFFQMVETLKNY